MTATFTIHNNLLHAVGITSGSHEDALAKWEFLHKCAVDRLLVFDGGNSTCSFCFGNTITCLGCPIYEVTGGFDCGDTPYGDYHRAVHDRDIDSAIKASARMVEFLKGLEE